MDWDILIDDEAIGSVLTEGYSHFTRPIREALRVFLSGLPAAAQHAIFASQTALPRTARTAERLGTLAYQCPVLHKLGQSLARDRRLDPALRRELSKLEVLPPSVLPDALRSALEQDLGSLEQLGIRLDGSAIAEASVAVVIGYQDAGQGGVFKVLKPGIEDRLELELGLLREVGVYLDERCAELGIPRLRYEEAFQEIEGKLRDEVKLTVEQRNLRLAAQQYANSERVQIPALREYCTARVTAMERVEGRKVTEHDRRSTHERTQLASLLSASLLARPLLSQHASALFHGDPHPGNLLLTDDGRLALLDWSIAGTLRERDREAMVQIALGAVLLDEWRVVEMLATMTDAPPLDTAPLLRVVREHLRAIRQGRLPDLKWVLRLMDDAVERAGLRARGDLVLFRKSLYMLFGLVEEVGGSESPLYQTLLNEFTHRLATEWPQRWLSTPDSRDFPTRLSNADLTALAVSYPAVAARLWMAHLPR